MDHVLIIEDDAALRETLVDVFEHSGYQVRAAADGISGLQMATEDVPALVISDVMMPKLSGYEVLKNLRTNPKTELLPVILLTAKVMTESKVQGLTLGADDYVTKPFEISELLLRANNLIETRRKIRRRNFLTPDVVERESQDDAFLRNLKGIIDKYIADGQFSIDTLAHEMHYSRSAIQKRVKKLTGKSCSQLIREYRLDRAYQLLEQRVGNISEVAGQVGFNSLSYFSHSFKQYFNQSPMEVLHQPRTVLSHPPV